MILQAELQAYSNEINLSLLNDVIAFVRSTSEADGTLKNAVLQRCVFLDPRTDSSAFQMKYGFLYLGELLERYETRFGNSIQDFRAIALALGYTCELVTDSMVVGAQSSNFLRRLKRRAEGDVYLTGAQYLLSRGKDDFAVLESKLLEMCQSTKTLLFVLSILPNPEQAFSRSRFQLLRFLSSERTLPVLGNMKMFAWLMEWLVPFIKRVKGKDAVLFRALSALPASFVKEESKHHTVLLEHGYSPLEIVYANMMAAQNLSIPGIQPTSTIIRQKIAVALFQEVLAYETPLPPEIYRQLSEVYEKYSRLRPKCYGHDTMPEALEEAPQISNVETLLWFSERNSICHPAFNGFDILDTKWDSLASCLTPEKYRDLFDNSLTENMEAADIQSRIARYNALSGRDYFSYYYSASDHSRFALLLKKEVLDLWDLFQNSLDGEGNVKWPHMMDRIYYAVQGIPTRHAYQFYEKFLTQHEIQDLERLWGYRHKDFLSSLIELKSSYPNDWNVLTLKIHQEFLSEEEQRQLVRWVEEYLFIYKPEQYLSFAAAVLLDETAVRLFSVEERQSLFKTVLNIQTLPSWMIKELKKRYMSEEDLQAERDAKKAAELEAERHRVLEMEQRIRRNYSDNTDGSFLSVKKFLTQYVYRQEEKRIAQNIIYEQLENQTLTFGQGLDAKEAACFLFICADLVNYGCMDIKQVKKYIFTVKESAENAVGEP